MFKHPEHTAEIHMLTRMAHPHISATAGIAIKNKDTTIVLEQPHCANGNNFQVRALEGSRCRNIGWGRRYRRDGLYYNGGRHIYGPKGIDIYIGGWWRYRWWRGRCGSAYWLNIYIRVKAPRDGRAKGLCGSFAGNRNKDERELIAHGGRRPHHQISRNTRNKWMVPASESFFKCGMWNPGFRFVLQWCGRDCHNEKNWKQLKAYPQKVYGDFLNKWRTMTARLPKEAMTATLRLRCRQGV